MDDSPRLEDLRRRVQEDPASSAFADLAEECRRGGAFEEAVAVCRAGLTHHPNHHDARVTLGRALIDLDRLDEAFAELSEVLDASPGNLPAIRALAEIYQRRGLMSEALQHYRRALELAQQDPELQQTVERLQEGAGASASPTGAVEELFDFDSLLAQLGSPVPADVSTLPPLPPPLVLPALEPVDDDQDDFASIERQLRDLETQRARDEQLAREVAVERRRMLVMQELEEWLGAILADRRPSQTT